MTPTLLRLHRWLGLVMGLLVLVAALTALGLNHRDLLHRFTSPPPATRDPLRQAVRGFAVDPTRARSLLLGTDDGLYRSTDAGLHWEEAILAVPAEHVVAIAFDPAVPGRVYTALEAIGLYRSDDHGEIWEEVPLPFQPAEGTHLRALAVAGDGGLVLSTTSGLLRLPGAIARTTVLADPASWLAVGPRQAAATEEHPGLEGWLYALHDGRVWGTWGVPVTDAVSLALVALVLSGYALVGVRAFRVRRAARRSVRLREEVAPA